MEKLKSVISIISSIIFILSLVLIFSCEGKKTISENKEKRGDTTITTTTTVDVDSNTNSGYQEKFKEESKELEVKLKALGEKAKQKGGDLGKSIKERTNKLEEERKGFHNDSTNSKLKENWNVFKEKTKKTIDSLGRKLDY